MRNKLIKALCGASVAAIATPALAQSAGGDDFVTNQPFEESSAATSEIIVTARRRDELVQDVPIVIDVVTAEDIVQLNLRDFREIAALVPGLQLQSEGIGGGGSIRGVSFDIAVSGNNPTVEFYMNDTPVTGNVVLQQVFDIEQIEVLRGPQGTLRGRASPSGAIAVTTRGADLNRVGANVQMTANEFGTMNINGGIGVPIIEGVLAVRVAGLYNVGDGNRVRSIVTGENSFNEAKSLRLSAAFEPSSWLHLEGVYQRQEADVINYGQVESANIFDSAQAASPIGIKAEDRLSILASPTSDSQSLYETYTWRAEVSAFGHDLIYLGNYRSQDYDNIDNSDNANYFPDSDFGQRTFSTSSDQAHEIRLQNVRRVAGLFDYVIGAFHQDANPTSNLVNQNAILTPRLFISETAIDRVGGSKETSYFANVTVHPSSRFEFSAGLRYIEIEGESQLFVNDIQKLDAPYKEDKFIYAASANYFVTDEAMVYGSIGTSFRPGPTAVGDFSELTSELQRSFTTLEPESSMTYEIGVKSQWFDDRLRFNLSAYYQDFDNFPYRGGDVYYQSFTTVNGALSPIVDDFEFIAGVPVTVKGVEGELSASLTPNWDFSLIAAYALSTIDNGLAPCNDLDGDGEPDFLQSQPTLAEVRAAYNDDFLGSCLLNQRASNLAPFSASLRTSYRQNFTPGVQGFGRALYSFTGKGRANTQTSNNDLDAFGILNLFAGLRDPRGRWELSLFAKNFLDETRITRGNNLVTTSFRFGRTAATATAPYRAVGISTGRELGVNVRFAFGSR